MTNSPSMFPNLFHNDKWQIIFSNIPSINGNIDMRLYDNYVKSFTIPDYNLQEIYSDGFAGMRIRHPVVTDVNRDLSNIQIEFKISEDFKNYINLFEWMRSLRYGNIETDDWARKYTIKAINLNILDNLKRSIAVMSFTEAFLVSISSVGLENGSSLESTFICNFSYEELKYETKSVLTA